MPASYNPLKTAGKLTEAAAVFLEASREKGFDRERSRTAAHLFHAAARAYSDAGLSVMAKAMADLGNREMEA